MSEPTIIINGQELSSGQAMAVRVAITNFYGEMDDMHALGKDEHGVAMATAYHARLEEVLKIILTIG